MRGTHDGCPGVLTILRITQRGYPIAPRPPLVGRDSEVRAIDDLLRCVEAGRSRVVVVWGEPGIGKTSLLHEALKRSAARGFTTLSGRAADREQDLSYAVFADLLERHADAVDLERLGVDERHLAPLRRVLPFLSPSGHGPEPQEHPARERHHVLRALHALLEALATEAPVVLALDDMHWADPESIDLVVPDPAPRHGPSVAGAAGHEGGPGRHAPAYGAAGCRATWRGDVGGAPAALKLGVRHTAQGRRRPRAAQADLPRERRQSALPRAARGGRPAARAPRTGGGERIHRPPCAGRHDPRRSRGTLRPRAHAARRRVGRRRSVRRGTRRGGRGPPRRRRAGGARRARR